MKIILRLQSRDKAAMLVQKTIQFFFLHRIRMKRKVPYQKGKTLLLLPISMTAVTSIVSELPQSSVTKRG